MFYTNAVAPVRLARTLMDRMREPDAVIAFMTSIMGSVALNTEGGAELYRASKAALNSLTRSFAAGLRGRPIAVLSFHPGWVRTDMGGEHAPLDVETSVRGIADVLERERGRPGHRFLDYTGHELPW
ncbi:MAG: SDR family NAD(P)-dependent oxidoreductase [Acetobacteraceae bacterium]|nr:SDR family NAD(P)-dependent oxidoreductase [Acetobacteraceae bacterium]